MEQAEAEDGGAASGFGGAARTAPRETLERFWQLASVEAPVREAAAAALLADLTAAAAAASKEDARAEENTGGAAAGGEAFAGLAPLVAYALRRLARGLGSGRAGARQGFALALSLAVAKVLPAGGRAARAVAVLDASIEPVTGATKGAEARDLRLGRLFGLAAAGRGLALAEGGAAHVAPADAGLLAQQLAELAAPRDRAYLREAAAAALLELLRPLPKDGAAEALAAAPALAAWLQAADDPAAVLITVSLQDKLPEGASAVPANVTTSEEALKDLLPVLKESSAAHPRVHTVWPAILDAAVSCGERGVTTTWNVLVEGPGGLLGSSHERKFLAFALFGMMLKRAKAEWLSALFTPTFMRTLVNNLGNPDNLLNAAAARCLSQLLRHVESDTGSKARVAVISALQRFGGGRFDKLTQTGAVKKLLQGLDATSLEEHTASLRQTFATGGGVDASEGPEAADGKRLWALEQLCGACKPTTAGAGVRRELAHFLLAHAFFELKPRTRAAAGVPDCPPPPSPPLTEGVRSACATRLLAVVAAQPPAPKPKQGGSVEEPAAPSPADDGPPLLEDAIEYCASLERAPKVAKLAVALPTSDAVAARKGAYDVLAKLRKQAPSPLRKALDQLTCTLLLLQLTDPSEYNAALQELPDHVAAAERGLDVAPAEGEDAPHPADALLDFLLSLLAKPSAMLRDAIESVFKAFTEHVTPQGLEDLLRVLETPVRGNGGDGVFSDDEEDEEDEDEEMEEDGEEKDDEEEDEDEDEEEDGDEDDDAEDAAGGDGEDDAVPGEPSEEELLRMETMIGKVIRAQRDSQKQKKRKQEMVVYFKFRTLALLELYIEKEPGSPNLPGLALPMLRSLKMLYGASAPDKEARPLVERLGGVVKNRLAKSRERPAGLDASGLRKDMEESLRLAMRSAVQGMGGAAAAAVHYLARVLAANDRTSEAVEVYAIALRDFFGSKKCRLDRRFFNTALDRFPWLGTALIPELSACVEMAAAAKGESRAEFLLVEAGALLSQSVKVHKGVSDLNGAEALRPHAAELQAVLVAVLGRAYQKPARRADAVAAAVGALHALRKRCDGGSFVFAPKALREASAAAEAALGDAAANKPKKLKSALAQLDSVLQHAESMAPPASGGGAEPKTPKSARKRGAEKAPPSTGKKAKKK